MRPIRSAAAAVAGPPPTAAPAAPPSHGRTHLVRQCPAGGSAGTLSEMSIRRGVCSTEISACTSWSSAWARVSPGMCSNAAAAWDRQVARSVPEESRMSRSPDPGTGRRHRRSGGCRAPAGRAPGHVGGVVQGRPEAVRAYSPRGSAHACRYGCALHLGGDGGQVVLGGVKAGANLLQPGRDRLASLAGRDDEDLSHRVALRSRRPLKACRSVAAGGITPRGTAMCLCRRLVTRRFLGRSAHQP